VGALGSLCRLTRDTTRHSGECWGRQGWQWPPDLICERFEVLRDGREMELVARPGEASQSHALKTMVNLQVGKTHLHFFALISRLPELRRIL
jgi:hypothetical protein